MLFQKLNNHPKMFTKLNHHTSLFSKQIIPQTIRHHIPSHSQSNENKYKNHLEISKY